MIIVVQILIFFGAWLYFMHLIITPEPVKSKKEKVTLEDAPLIMYEMLIRQREIIICQAYVIIGETFLLVWVFFVLVVVR